MKEVFCQIRGILSLSIYIINTVFWSIPIYGMAILKLIVPYRPFRKICDRLLNRLANNWIFTNNMTQRIFCNIRWHVFSPENLNLHGWYLVVANHQSWVDILVLQNIFYKKIPFLKFFLKQELFWIPVIGQAWWALDFPFMRRYTNDFLKKNPHLKGTDLEITRKACEKFKNIPVTVMNFAEGTRYTPKKHAGQGSPHKYLLKPRAGGIAFALSAMGEHFQSIIDVTIAYPEGVGSFWDFLCGKVTDIRVQISELPITPDMLGNYMEDPEFRLSFQNWLNLLWTQKDECIQELISTPHPDAQTGAASVPPFRVPFPVEGNAL